MPPTEFDVLNGWVKSLAISEKDLWDKYTDLEKRYIELAQYLRTNVFPRLDRIEGELQIDETIPQ